MARISITINSKSYPIHDDDQEAAALIRLAGDEPREFDLFLVERKGDEERIRDNQIVNLKDGQKFVTRRKISFTIDGEPFRTFDDDQTAAALLRLAGVNPEGYDLARVEGAPGTFTGDQLVTLNSGDAFITAKQVGPVA